MSVFGSIFVAMLAALGVALTVLELFRRISARKAKFICICFREELLENGEPDMLIIVRTDTEADEVIKRICSVENRKVYIKRI